MKTALQTNWPWIIKEGLRETRHSARRLLLLCLSLAAGISSLLAVELLSALVKSELDTKSKALLGADLVLSTETKFPPDIEEELAGIPGKQSYLASFLTMAYFPKWDALRLVNVRAISGDFPHYGTIDSSPQLEKLSLAFGEALLEESLILQYEQNPATPNGQMPPASNALPIFELGEKQFTAKAKLRSIPGELAARSFFAPRVIINYDSIAESNLLEKGSRVKEQFYFSFDSTSNYQQAFDKLTALADKHHLQLETVTSKQTQLMTTVKRVSSYLTLISIATFLLSTLATILLLRHWCLAERRGFALKICIGALRKEAFLVSLMVIFLALCLALIIGSVFGLILLGIIANVASTLLPIKIDLYTLFYSPSILFFTVAKVATTSIGGLVLATLPLITLAHTPLISVIREAPDPTRKRLPREYWPGLLLGFLAIFGTVFFYTYSLSTTLVFVFLLSGSIIGLALLTRLVLWLATLASSMPFSFGIRYALKHFGRSVNWSLSVVLLLGLTCSLISLTLGIRSALLNELSALNTSGQPNTLVFDIQPDDLHSVISTIENANLKVVEQVPIISMRLTEINNEPVQQISARTSSSETWALNRIYRSSYRTYSVNGEKLLTGVFPPQMPSSTNTPIPISAEDRIVKALGLKLGDLLRFEISGQDLLTTISSIRQADWQRVQPNFFFIFPEEALRNKPAFWALSLFVGDVRQLAQLERSLYESFPNISTLDFRAVEQAISRLSKDLSLALSVVGLTACVSAVLVLIASLAQTLNTRRRELTLLKTLGATRATAQLILLTELLLIGFSSSLLSWPLVFTTTGLWGIHYRDSFLVPDLSLVLYVTLGVVAIVLVTGSIWMRSIKKQ